MYEVCECMRCGSVSSMGVYEVGECLGRKSLWGVGVCGSSALRASMAIMRLFCKMMVHCA